MGLWHTYSHCQAVTDLDELRQDASALKSASEPQAGDGFVVPLPGQIERMVVAPGTRQAVDIKAMAASCTLRAGQTALNLQKFDVAKPILESIVQYYPQSEYSYYSNQAKSMLAVIDAAMLKVSLNFR
ncbi:hypothetical protein W02_12910 [Nitrospira sp. KM1]|nr:hypothetical protein W02_12910 [Nitrospira sp. KM1]